MLGTTGTQAALESSYAATFAGRAMLELNMNRYAQHMYTEREDNEYAFYGASSARWTPAQYDTFITTQYGSNFGNVNNSNYMKEKFPITSVVNPIRPSSQSIVKPTFMNANVSTNLKWRNSSGWNNLSVNSAGMISSDGTYLTLRPRPYWAGIDDEYKYFMTGYGINTAYCYYAASVWANKIVVVFENSEYEPSITVEVTQDGTNWTVVKTSTAITRASYPTGRLELYNNVKTGLWSMTTSQPTYDSSNSFGKDYCAKIMGIRVTKSSSKPMSIIEISPRTQIDISQYVSGWSTEQNLSENDSLSPVGTASANTATLELDNTATEADGFYTWEQRRVMGAGATGPTYLGEFAKKHARVTFDILFNSEYLPQFNMYVDDIEVVEGDTATFKLIDDGGILQATQAPNIVLRNVTPTQAIWRMLDAVGYDRVRIKSPTVTPYTKEPLINWFSSDDSKTIWDTIKEVCASHKYSVWVDASGYVNIATASWMLNKNKTINWTFDAVSGANPADIVNHSETLAPPLNSVVIKYTPQKVASDADPGQNAGIAVVRTGQTRVLSTAPRTVLLGSVNQHPSGVSATATAFRIDPTAVRQTRWGSYAGYFLVDQEVIKYDGIQVKYTTAAGTGATATVRSADELQEVYTEAVGTVDFTGNLMNLKRGQFGTKAAAHNGWLAGWSIADPKCLSQVVNTDPPGITLHDVHAGRAQNTFLGMYKSLSGSGMDVSSFNHFATTFTLGKLRTVFLDPSGKEVSASYTGEKTRKTYISNDDGAGLVIGAKKSVGNLITDGYYIEVRSSAKQDKEVGIIPITGGLLERHNGVYGDATIKPGHAIDLTVVVTTGHKEAGTTVAYIDVYINGIRCLRGKTAMSSWNSRMSGTTTSNIALMVTNATYATFHWVAASRPGRANSTSIHNYAAGHQATLIKNIFEYKKSAWSNIPYYYEPMYGRVRELYVEDVKFTKFPALTYNWYPIVNTPKTDKTTQGTWIARSYDVAAAIADVNPFGARIVIGNVGTRPVVLQEDGGVAYPMIYGKVVERIETEQTITRFYEQSVVQYGEQKFEASPTWITNHVAANALADWILAFSKTGLRYHTISVFSNPLIEIGDMVTMNYPNKNITTAKMRFVVRSIRKTWTDGIDMEVELVEIP